MRLSNKTDFSPEWRYDKNFHNIDFYGDWHYEPNRYTWSWSKELPRPVYSPIIIIINQKDSYHKPPQNWDGSYIVTC